LNDIVHNFRKGGKKVRGIDFGVEKDFRGKEALVTNIDAVFL
jgi:hypothetical protein